MSFDQFQRYKTVQVIVEQLKARTGQQQVSILEIGGNGQCNLEEMLPGEQIQYSNLTIPKERIGDDRFIVLDGTDMPQVASDAYDVVIALDVFEHVPVEKRERFLSETYRVAKYVTILCFPFANGKNESAEQRVNNYYKAIYGKNHIWLEEHIENGLPVLAETEAFLQEKKMDYHLFRHGDISVWEEWMKALFGSYDIPGVADYVHSLEEYYKQELYRRDVGKDNYRVFLLMAKDKKLIQEVGETVEQYFSADAGETERAQMFRGLADLKQLCARRACQKVESSLYVDCGNGYSENTKLVKEIMAGADGEVQFNCEYEIPENCVSLRFDPVENSGCILNNLRITSEQGVLSVQPVNGWEQHGVYVFAGNDPQMMIDIADKNITHIKVEGTMQICPRNMTGMALEVADKMVTEHVRWAEDALRARDEMCWERDEVIKRNERLQQEKAQEHARAELYEKAYQGVITSKTWKLTAPFRKIFGKKESQ